MELFRRTLAGLLMLVVAVSVGIWVQGKFIDAVRLPTHTRVIGATYTTLSDPFYETINDEIQMQIKSNGDLLLVRDPGQDQERQNQEIEDMLNKGIELLIVNPVDYVGVTPALEKAREKGVRCQDAEHHILGKMRALANNKVGHPCIWKSHAVQETADSFHDR